MSSDLTRSLAEHEAVIERGLNTFVEVGTALLAIREERLYRAEYSTFEEYCRERWGLSRPRAYELIDAAEVVSAMADTGLPGPTNERQARELGRVPEEQRAEVWRETLERTDGKPTAAAVRETYSPPPVEPAPERESPPVRPPISNEQIAELRSIEDRPESQAPEPPASMGPSEAELYASLDETMEGTDARFRLNFGRAMKSLFTVLSFDRGRIVEAVDHKTLQGELDLLTEWADDLRRRMRPGLRIVNGDQE